MFSIRMNETIPRQHCDDDDYRDVKVNQRHSKQDRSSELAFALRIMSCLPDDKILEIQAK